MRNIQLKMWLTLIFIIVSVSETGMAQVERNALNPTEISSDVSSDSLFIHFNSEHGFLYETKGFPLIGEHYPFVKAMPDKIRVDKYASNESISSVIIPNYFTENAGYKTFHGISNLSSKFLLLGIAVLFGSIANLGRNIIAAFIGKNHPALENLFLYGFGVGFFLSVLFIDDITKSFGENKLVYFDNANNAPYRVIVTKHDAVEIGARENMGAYLELGWNDLEVYPVKGSENTWSGRIFINNSDGYLVFNIGSENQYKVETAVWEK